MANINPSDTSIAIIKEVTAGTTPASPAFIPFEFIPGDMPTFEAEMVTSNVLKANRASGGGRKAAFAVGGGLKTHFRRGLHMDLLLESALSGQFATNVLKASNVDTNFTVETKRLDAAAAAYYHRHTGCQVKDMTLSCNATGNAEISFGIVGMNRTTGTAILTSATYPAVAASTNLMGLDVTAVTVAGLTAVFNSLELTVSHNREAQSQFGSASARGIGTSGFRTVSLKLSFYRSDLSADTLLATADTPVAVSFTIGATTNGWTFTLPAANYNVPQDIEDGSKQLLEVTFVGSYDNTALTDLSITKLT